MTFSFEPFLAISAGHIMAVSAGPEHAGYIAIFFFIYFFIWFSQYFPMKKRIQEFNDKVKSD